jgi:hypothetical protein
MRDLTRCQFAQSRVTSSRIGQMAVDAHEPGSVIDDNRPRSRQSVGEMGGESKLKRESCS